MMPTHDCQLNTTTIENVAALMQRGEAEAALAASIAATDAAPNHADALATCKKLPETTEFWTGGLMSVRDIRSQCERIMIQRKAA